MASSNAARIKTKLKKTMPNQESGIPNMCEYWLVATRLQSNRLLTSQISGVLFISLWAIYAESEIPQKASINMNTMPIRFITLEYALYELCAIMQSNTVQ